MPIKQVVCVICKETVNKAQTYQVGGTPAAPERACKKHEGVTDKKTALEAQKEKAQAMSVQKAEHRRPEGGYGGHSDWSTQNALTPKCWVCMNTGLRSQDFFMKMLIEMKKAEVVHGKPLNPFFGPGAVRLGVRCIFVLPKEKCEGVMKYVREEFRTLIQMAGFVAVCADCCKVGNIEPMAPVTGEQLRAGMVVAQVIDPALREQAVQEPTRDN